MFAETGLGAFAYTNEELLAKGIAPFEDPEVGGRSGLEFQDEPELAVGTGARVGDLEAVPERPKLNLSESGLSLAQQELLARELPFGAGEMVDSVGNYLGTVKGLNNMADSLVGMGAFALIMPKITAWLDSLGEGGKYVSGAIEIGGWASMLWSDNPIGLALYLG